jgi:hypothetical protein
MTPDRRKNRELVFQDCLDQLQQGERSLEAVLAQYPEHSETLKPDLETARWLRERGTELQPRPGFVAASHRRLVSRIETEGAPTPASRLRWSFDSLRYPSTWRQYLPRVAMVYVLLVVLLLNLGRLSTASLNWLPGDFGYPVKPAMEEIALLVSPGAANDARLHIQFAHRRLMEVQALVLENRYDQIPATVANFDRHVDRAVRAVDRVARQDRPQAQDLALDLQGVLSKQTPLVVLLTGFTPEGARADFQRVLSISEDGLSAMQKVLEPGNNGANGLGPSGVSGAGALGARQLAYTFVRWCFAG